MKRRALILGVCAVLLGSSAGHAQTLRDKTKGIEPCCSITAINSATAIVTATDPAGKSFQFKVADRALFGSLKVGQKVFADFGTAKVQIRWGEPCCNIIPSTGAGQLKSSVSAGARGNFTHADGTSGAAADANFGGAAASAAPCCGITNINAAAGVVTARDLKSGRVFRFQVNDAALLKSMRVGQQVYADFTNNKVRIHGAQPCCAIIQ